MSDLGTQDCACVGTYIRGLIFTKTGLGRQRRRHSHATNGFLGGGRRSVLTNGTFRKRFKKSVIKMGFECCSNNTDCLFIGPFSTTKHRCCFLVKTAWMHCLHRRTLDSTYHGACYFCSDRLARLPNHGANCTSCYCTTDAPPIKIRTYFIRNVL